MLGAARQLPVGRALAPCDRTHGDDVNVNVCQANTPCDDERAVFEDAIARVLVGGLQVGRKDRLKFPHSTGEAEIHVEGLANGQLACTDTQAKDSRFMSVALG